MQDEWTCDVPPPPRDCPKLAPETLAAVRALQGGEADESAGHLFATFEPELGAYFRRHGCQADEAEDLTQNVFMQMLERIGTLKDATRFHFWLFRIARNFLRNFMRDRARSSEGLEEFADKARKDSESGVFWVRGTFEPSPEVRLAMRETVDLRRCYLRTLLKVSRLAERTRRTLVRRLHGDSYEEIARKFGIRVGTVGSQLSRATDAMLRSLEKIDPDGVALEDEDDDPVAELSAEVLTFKREALEADPAYFRAGVLESASASHDVAEESDDEALVLLAEDEDSEDDEVATTRFRVADSPAAIAAVRRQDRARGRTRRKLTRTILPAGGKTKGLDFGPLGKEDLGYPALLLKEAAAFLADGGGRRAVKAKLTCAGSLLARGRRFQVARQAEKVVRKAIVAVSNGHFHRDGVRDQVRHEVAEGCHLLRSFLGRERAGHLYQPA